MSKSIDANILLQHIDNRIAKLVEMRKLVAEEFGLQNGNHVATTGRNRKEQIIDVITKRGPLGRKELIDATGMPVGTISYVLNDKKLFKHLENGQWDLVEGAKKK